jgi:hypothetical protein
MTTLGRIRSFAPTAAKLADSKGEYLSVIKARRQEEAAARKEREVRHSQHTSSTAGTSGMQASQAALLLICETRKSAYSAVPCASADGGMLVLPAVRSDENVLTAWLGCQQGRRRRMLVEQQAARSAAEGRVEADCLLEVLVRRSTEEQKLAQHLWQLQQEKVGRVAPNSPAYSCLLACWLSQLSLRQASGNCT